MAIPHQIQEELFPSPHLSILGLLQYQLPLIAKTLPPDTTCTSFFHNDLPTMETAASISQILSPPINFVQLLQRELPKAIKRGCRSLQCPHSMSTLGNTYPLWVIEYWLRIDDVRCFRDAWCIAEGNLQEKARRWNGKGKLEARNLVYRILDGLSTMEWSNRLAGFSSNATESLAILTAYTSNAWFRDEHANQMLELLQKQLARAHISSVEIASTWLYETISKGFEKDEYLTAKNYQSCRHLAYRLKSGTIDCLGLLINHDRNHWVAAVIDFREHRILYGDPMGIPIPSTIQKRLTWWTQLHTDELFTYDLLPITHQQDMFSCCLLSWNALQAYFLEAEELMSSEDVFEGRLKVLINVIDEHQSQLNMITESPFDIQTISEHGPYSELAESQQGEDKTEIDSYNNDFVSMDVTVNEDNEGDSESHANTPSKDTKTAEPQGLFRYFKKGTIEQFRQDLDRQDERMKQYRENDLHRAEKFALKKAADEREAARLRKEKSRAKKREEEVAAGLRDSNGKKRRFSEMELADIPSPLENTSIAELSRPARALKEKFKAAVQKPQGRQRTNLPRPAKYHNWFSPFLWSQIEKAKKHAGWDMKASAIVAAAKKIDPVVFKGLSRTTVEGWIDRSGKVPRWTENVLRRIQQGNNPGHNKGGQRSVLSRYPAVCEAIKARLLSLREAGAPLTVITMRGIMLAVITVMEPSILDLPYRDGSTFKASDQFVRRWVKENLNWVERKATRAAQKVPADWEDKCEKSFLRKAYSIKEYDIPSPLYVNSDQTQVVYAPGDKMTYAECGAKQVSLVGGEEKRAFTVMVSVSNDGFLLPFQAIYEGKTNASCPSKDSPHYEDVIRAGMLLEFSGTATYWSNMQTMKNFVKKILDPYFNRIRASLNLPSTQKALWQIDVWSVHRSKEFRDWMSANYSNIIIDFVPGGCTGRHQPCDVGIQRPFKHSMKRSYHEAVVNEMLESISTNEAAGILDKRLKTVRDRSVTWLWNAYRAVNHVNLVRKAFEMCTVRGWNLSYSSLTSFEAREKLRNLKEEDREFGMNSHQTKKTPYLRWNRLSQKTPSLTIATAGTLETIAASRCRSSSRAQ
ncbi:hypothetical protein BJ912DRAFT_241100 [Pholiota molesta]|nr:hypothetical protein BJ912DRAFT_241100 [Pholiota molesta]